MQVEEIDVPIRFARILLELEQLLEETVVLVVTQSHLGHLSVYGSPDMPHAAQKRVEAALTVLSE